MKICSRITKNMPIELQTFILAMTPIGELRASIPFAVELHQMSWFSAYLISVIGNMIPVFFIFIFLDPVVSFFSRISKTFEKMINVLFKKTKKDNEKRIKKRGYLALIGFTAIPLPISGAWTASLVAYLFGLDYKKSFGSIFIGVLLAGFIVLGILRLGDLLKGFTGIQIFLGFLIFGLLLHYLLKSKKN